MSTQDNIPYIQLIPIESIEPSPMNPRKTFSEDALRELSESISEQGLLQPITVRPSDYDDYVEDDQLMSIPIKYEIVCGERRYRACRMAGMTEIPCIVREMSDDEAFDAMITENLQRKDVDPIEEAEAFTILSGRGQSVAELASRFGRSESYIRDRMRLVSLIGPLQKELSKGQITLRGAYLLSRLSEDDQNDFVENEVDLQAEGLVTTEDVTEWLDRKFMNLFRAPFQNGKDLTEEWNPKGKYIRRCQTCECNTNNHGCLFADMKTDEPQCIDETCYSRKCDIFYDNFIKQYAFRITAAGQSIKQGDVALRAGSVYGSEDTKRLNDLKEKMASYGYRIFTEKELPDRVWGGEANRKKALETGAAVEVIELDEMARQYRRPGISCFRLRSKVATSSSADSHFMASRLLERAAAAEKTAEKKITSAAKKAFNREEYMTRTGALEPYEETILMAIVFYRLRANDGNELIPGSYCSPTYEQMQDFLKMHANDNRWKRKAIVEYMESAQSKPSMFSGLVSHLHIEVEDFANRTRQEAEARIESINDELREMGYDENGNKL